MADHSKTGKDGVTSYYISGREVSKEKYEEYYPPLTGAGFPHMAGWSRPMEMDSLAVHPDDIPAQMEKDRRHGLMVNYNQDGCPIIHTEQQKRDYMKSRHEKMIDRNSYF
jgi:hypothetical protein